MVIGSIAEVVSIGMVLPFLGMITAPEQFYQYPIMQPTIHILKLTNPDQLILPVTIAFIIAVLLSSAIRLILLYVMIRVSFATGADISINIYRRTLYQEYLTHVERNSSEVINSIVSKTSVTVGVIKATLTLISSSVILIGIIIALLTIDIKVALTAFIGFGILYWGLFLYNRTQLNENSKIIANQSTIRIKSLQEGLGGIRDVLIDGSQPFYCNLYRNADIPMRHALGKNTFIRDSPRYAMEAIGMIIIAILAYLMTQQQEDITTVIPVLGAFALGAQKLLPALQQIYSSFSGIKGAKSSFKDVLDLLNQPLPNYLDQPLPMPIRFNKEIILSNLSFRYRENTPWVLKNINLKITKGERVGFIGITGSGKSTLLDVVMGLLPLTTGEIKIDDTVLTRERIIEWQRHIAHVPQNIYLSDCTIEENIAFGSSIDKIDHKQVEKAAKQAQISELIEEWKDGYQTFVGERGVKLSGGQRQRIGIARALYKQSNVLIFDEATSSLDSDTEYEVMEAIESLGNDITILIIAHRLTTLQGCDKIFKLGKNHKIKEVDYHDAINPN